MNYHNIRQDAKRAKTLWIFTPSDNVDTTVHAHPKCDFLLCSFETATARNRAFLPFRLCIRMTSLNAQLTLGTVKPRVAHSHQSML